MALQSNKNAAGFDEPVYEYIVQNATEVAGERKWPIWKLIPGAESEQLPFNERIASYSTTSNGFKASREPILNGSLLARSAGEA